MQFDLKSWEKVKQWNFVDSDESWLMIILFKNQGKDKIRRMSFRKKSFVFDKIIF